MPDLLGNEQPKDKSGKEKVKGRAKEAAGALTNDKDTKEKGKENQGKKSGGGLGNILGS